DAPETEARPLRHRMPIPGPKPGLLLVDGESTRIDLSLVAEGFDVYRTTRPDSALELLRAHPGILMALVRMDLPGLDSAALIRDLRRIRPGHWIDMWGDPADRDRAAEGYAAGATDLIPSSGDPGEIAERLLRTVPGAVRRRRTAERRRASGRGSRILGRTAGMAAAVALGVVLALMTRAWHDSRDEWKAR